MIEKRTGMIFIFSGLTKNSWFVPDGWFIDEESGKINPSFCEKYTGEKCDQGAMK